MNQEQIIEELKKIIEYDTTENWSKGFSLSLIKQTEQGYKLSPKQTLIAKRIIEENSAENIEKRLQEKKAWELEYEEKYKEKALIVANYYLTTRYYGSIIKTIVRGEVPRRNVFMKLYKNKYAQRVLEESERPPRFSISSVVIGNAKASYNPGLSVLERVNPTDNNLVGHKSIRTTRTSYKSYSMSSKEFLKDFDSFKTKGAFILGVDTTIKSPVKGGKRYKILPIGSNRAYWVEERYLKNKPKSKKVKK